VPDDLAVCIEAEDVDAGPGVIALTAANGAGVLAERRHRPGASHSPPEAVSRLN
jgi:hypothetical protein